MGTLHPVFPTGPRHWLWSVCVGRCYLQVCGTTGSTSCSTGTQGGIHAQHTSVVAVQEAAQHQPWARPCALLCPPGCCLNSTLAPRRTTSQIAMIPVTRAVRRRGSRSTCRCSLKPPSLQADGGEGQPGTDPARYLPPAGALPPPHRVFWVRSLPAAGYPKPRLRVVQEHSGMHKPSPVCWVASRPQTGDPSSERTPSSILPAGEGCLPVLCRSVP